MLVLSTRIILDCFYLLIFYSEKFSTDVCRLPYAVNVNLNLSNVKAVSVRARDQGFPLPTISWSPDYFYWRQREKKEAK